MKECDKVELHSTSMSESVLLVRKPYELQLL